MITTSGWRISAGALLATLPAVARAAEDHEGKLVLKLDGKDVTLKLAGGSYGKARPQG